MKLDIFLKLFTLLAIVILSNADTPLECPYNTISGDYVGLYYFPTINKGQEHIDYGHNTNKVCELRASCPDPATYVTKIERCSDFNVNCDNQHTYEGKFPACCVKC